MANDEQSSIRFELQGAALQGEVPVFLASWPRPDVSWGTDSHKAIDVSDLAHWNASFARDLFEFYVTAQRYDASDVRYVTDNNHLLVKGAGGYKDHLLPFRAHSLVALADVVWVLGPDGSVANLKSGRLQKLSFALDPTWGVLTAAANVAGQIVAVSAHGQILTLKKTGRKLGWESQGQVEGALGVVQGLSDSQWVVGGERGLFFHDDGRWLQILRGSRGSVTCLSVAPDGEILAGTSNGELWAGSTSGMKRVPVDTGDKSAVGGLTRFGGALFVAQQRLLRLTKKGFEPVTLSGFVPRLSCEAVPRLLMVEGALWVVGPFSAWRSTDGLEFLPHRWR